MKNAGISLLDNIKLEIDESAVLKIVDIAYKSTTGARSLKQVMEKIMLDIMFNSFSIAWH